jgi:hypothetical protein
MFSAYMQEGNLTIFIIFSLFYIHFCVGPQVCIGNSRLRIFTVCLGVVVSDTSSIYTHAHTHIILPPHFTNNVSLPTTRCSHATFWLLHGHGPRQASLCWVLYVCADLRHRLERIIHENKSRNYIWNFLTPVKERINVSYHTYIQSRHMVCKLWRQNVCVSWERVIEKWPFLWTE